MSKCIELLIDLGADINLEGQYRYPPIFLVASEGFQEVVEIIFVNRAEWEIKTKENKNLLHVAAKGNLIKLAQFLLDYRMPGLM